MKPSTAAALTMYIISLIVYVCYTGLYSLGKTFVLISPWLGIPFFILQLAFAFYVFYVGVKLLRILVKDIKDIKENKK
jgi:hypothetical protein